MHRRGVVLLQICISRQIKFAVAILCLCILCSRSSATADGPRDAMCQSKFLQLPYSSVGTCCTTSPDQIQVMEFEGYSRPTYFHSATTCSTVVCVMHKLTVDEFVDHSSTPTTWCGEVLYVQNVEITHLILTTPTRLMVHTANRCTKSDVSSQI